MKCFWITGARGFIGRHLAKKLAVSGHNVAGLGYGAWPTFEARKWGISYWLSGDVIDRNLSYMKGELGNPDGIFHLAGGSSVGAAFANPKDDYNRTVGSTAALLEWVRRHSPDTPIVAVSSAAVYGTGHEGLIHENYQLLPYSTYGLHKLIMEELCRTYAKNFGLWIAIPRLFSVYGKELKKQLLWDTCKKLQSWGKAELGGTGDELRDWTCVTDVAAVLEKQISWASNSAPVLNIATGYPVSVRDITNILATNWSFEKPPNISFSGISRPGDPKKLCADVTQLNFHNAACTTLLSDGIAEYVAWFRSLEDKL